MKKRLRLFVTVTAACLGATLPSWATIYPFNNTYTGSQEVPSNASPGTGTIIGSYNDVTNTISYTITFNGLMTNTTQAHFHSPAAPGVNAPVVIAHTGFPTGVTSGSFSKSDVLTEAQEADLLAGLWYSNIHTVGLPAGEIRAQIKLQTLQATVPYTTCPNAAVAIIRAGGNSDNTNPYYLYNVAASTGTFTQVAGGPYKDPDNIGVNLQVNGIGLNTADGFIYGMATQTTISTTRFVRLDRAYGSTSLGSIVPPSSPTAIVGGINSGAGDVDRSNNYWFTGFTANPSFGSPTGFVLDKLFIGKISNLTGLPIAGNPVPQYFEIDYTDANCAGYISTFNTDPGNSGLKDFCYNPFSSAFVTYVTFKPTGATNYSGQLVELKPIPGSSPLKYKMTCKSVVNTHTAEVSGTLIDNAGNFIVLLTDGTVGKIGISANQYNGVFTVLNASTGLPNPLRADMGSCGGLENAPLPIRLNSFTAKAKDCNNIFEWKVEGETGFNHFELEQSTDGRQFTTVANIASRRTAAYQTTLPSAGKQAYYRLKLIDNDGSYNYSSIVTVADNCSRKFGFALSPNPAITNLNINWYGLETVTQIEISIFNASGAVVSRSLRQVTGNSLQSIDVSKLPKGAYWVKGVDTKANVSYQANFVKQ